MRSAQRKAHAQLPAVGKLMGKRLAVSEQRQPQQHSGSSSGSSRDTQLRRAVDKGAVDKGAVVALEFKC